MTDNKSGALAGIKVASFCSVAAGPLIIRYLAVHGATVVRVESHTRPDILRVMAPYMKGQPGVDNEPWFANVNTSTYGISIDLNTPRGKDLAWKLVKWADVVAENFGPGVMGRWGLDYESVRKVKADVIYMSSSQMGQTGPLSRFAGYGYQASARAGFTHLSGWPDRDPAPSVSAYADFIAPRFGATALLAALDYRRRTGKGQYLDQSQSESCAHILAPTIMDYITNGRIAGRDGNRLPWAAPHGVYLCQGDDRWCAIAVFSDDEWQAFSKAIGGLVWTQEQRFATLLGRKDNEDDLDKLIGEWTSTHTAEEVEATMQTAGIAASVVENARDLAEDQQLGHRGFFRQFEHPVMGSHTYRNMGFRLSRTPDVQFAAPTLGQHNEYVLRDLLGLSDAEIADALVEGAITTEAQLPEMRSGM